MLGHGVTTLLQCHFCIMRQSLRSLTVLKRRFPVPLVKPGFPLRRLKARNYVYDKVLVDTTVKIPPIDCILTAHVDGLGERGDTVSVKRRTFRYELYPAGLAVYASPDNIAEFDEEMKATKHIPKLSRFAYLTWLQLWGVHLDIPMSADHSWVLNTSHVTVAFRLAGIELNDECITIPEEAITSPQDLEVIVNVNGIKKATVSASIYTVYQDPSKNAPHEPRPWLSREECYSIIQNEAERIPRDDREDRG